MKSWTAADNGKVDEIKFALRRIASEFCTSYDEEIEWLDKLKDRE